MILDFVVTILSIIIGSSLVTILMSEFLRNRQNRKELYGFLQFHLARLLSVIENKEAIIGQINEDGILDRASLENQKKAMAKIYKVLGNNFHYLKKKHQLSARTFIGAYNDQSPQRAKKLVSAIEALQKDIKILRKVK